ncbi:MAG: hypothetical protein AAGH87_08070, partial [Pseudomonadota bacterium]
MDILWSDDLHFHEPWDSPWADDPDNPFDQPYFFQADDTPGNPGPPDTGDGDDKFKTYVADTWGYFDQNGNDQYDDNEIFLFADESLTVEDTDGTAKQFFETFTAWP